MCRSGHLRDSMWVRQRACVCVHVLCLISCACVHPSPEAPKGGPSPPPSWKWPCPFDALLSVQEAGDSWQPAEGGDPFCLAEETGGTGLSPSLRGHLQNPASSRALRSPGMREHDCQGGVGQGWGGSAQAGGDLTVLVGEGCTLPPPARPGWRGVWVATRGAHMRPCVRGAERRVLWLMCPIKLLQTLQRQLLPAGPWVQIGSVSLPRVVSAGPESGGQLRRHTAGLLPLVQPGPAPASWHVGSLWYPWFARSCAPPDRPDPPLTARGPLPALTVCLQEWGFQAL